MTGSIVSILIPTFNRAGLVTESVEAVLSACRPQDEIIIMNDGSTDNTVDVLSRFGDRIRIITTPNQGKSAALNMAIGLCKGDLIWIVDDDDLVLPDSLTRLLGLLDAHPDAGIAYGRHDRFRIDETGARESLGTGYWSYGTTPENFLAASLDDFFVHQPGMIVRKDVYAKAGPFSEILPRSLDYEMLIRLVSCTRAVGTDEIVFLQRVHDGVRGRAGATFSESERWEVWARTDREIFQKLHATLPLSAYSATPLPGDPAPSERQLLLRRGVVMARHRNWDLATKDFCRARDSDTSPLNEADKDILRGAFNAKYGCREVLTDPAIVLQLCTLAQQPPGQDITRTLARAIRWRIREALSAGKVRDAAGYARVMLRLGLTRPANSSPTHGQAATAE